MSILVHLELKLGVHLEVRKKLAAEEIIVGQGVIDFENGQTVVALFGGGERFGRSAESQAGKGEESVLRAELGHVDIAFSGSKDHVAEDGDTNFEEEVFPLDFCEGVFALFGEFVIGFANDVSEPEDEDSVADAVGGGGRIVQGDGVRGFGYEE